MRCAPAYGGHRRRATLALASSFRLAGVHAQQAGFPVLRGVDLDIHDEVPVALLGPSGAGKTSLLRLLGGTLLPSQGEAQLLDVNPRIASPAELRDLRRRVGFVHQDLALVPNLRVLPNVLAGRLGRFGLLGALRHLLWPSPTTKAQVFALLEELGIEEKLFEPVRNLSGGEAQRVALARALYQEPSVLLADEPVASVDPSRARSVLELLLQVARDRSIPLVVSLHQADLAKEYFPRLVGLRQGRVLFDCAREEVRAADWDALYETAEDGAERPGVALPS